MLDVRQDILIKNILAGCVLAGCLFFLPNGVQAATSDSATLEWAANFEPDLAGYRIYHGTSSGIYGLPQTVGKTTTYQYHDLAPNKTHYFTLTAFDASGNESLPSSEVSKYIPDSSASDLLPPSSLTISNLMVASGRSYVVPTSGLQAEGTVYIDRSYTFSTVPAGVQGAAYIQTANDDKAVTTANFLSFEVNQPVTVYVAHDTRITSKPSWLSTFTDTSKNLVTSDTTLRLFARDFSAGTITLGGNASGGGFSMYAVIVQPQEGFKIANLTVANGKSYVVPASGLQVGSTVYIDRSYTFSTVPAGVQGAVYIQTANDDKAVTTANFLSFEVNQPVTVYVAYDARITTKPAWLGTFTDTGKDFLTSDTKLHLFARSFSAGTITLGGNASGGGFSMYAVIVQP
jgi:hypothetical protein